MLDRLPSRDRHWLCISVLVLPRYVIAEAHNCTASLVSLLAHSRKVDRAVINSLRNFLRTIGGTLGLTGMILALNFLITHVSHTTVYLE